MAEVGELEGGRADGAANGEEQLEQWNGDVPDDTKPWCKDLHRLVSKIYGGEDRPGGEPTWWVDCDDDFLALEDMRRNLPKDSLNLLRNTAYCSASMTMVEYVTGRNATVSVDFYSEMVRRLVSGNLSRCFMPSPSGGWNR
mgnify:CR=1 FL=1